MDTFTANQAMSLNDARLILAHEIARGTFHGVVTLDDCYDASFEASEHHYYNEYTGLALRYSVDIDYTDHDRTIDAEYLKQLGAWATALHVVNRALPCTPQQAFLADDWFRHELLKGYADAARADGRTVAQIQDGWRALWPDPEYDAYMASLPGDDDDDHDEDRRSQLELDFNSDLDDDEIDGIYATLMEDYPFDAFVPPFIKYDAVMVQWLKDDDALRCLADYILALVLWQCGFEGQGLDRIEATCDAGFRQRWAYWRELDHDEVIYAMGSCDPLNPDGDDRYDA